jgi:phosphate transport system substrate-binding protein
MMIEREDETHMNGPATRGVARRFGGMPFLLLAMLALVLAATALVACSDDDGDGGNGDGATATTSQATEPMDDLSGDIDGDGSSTVFPITEAVAEEFGQLHSGVRVTAGIAGTGGGFEKFCAGETDFNDASRPIKDEEAQTCADAGIEFTEFQVAFDGLSVVTNPSNDFVDCLTVEELKKIWEPAAERTITNWSQVRDGFPDKGLSLYGPGTDSGTFDYFTEEINGETDASRGDYQASEDDNVLVQGIVGDEGGLGYFGLAYYEENADQLKLISVDGGAGCVAPSSTTVLDGTYTPLSRPLFVYFTNESLTRPEVQEFVRFYLTEGAALAAEVGYVEASDAIYQEGLAKLP